MAATPMSLSNTFSTLSNIAIRPPPTASGCNVVGRSTMFSGAGVMVSAQDARGLSNLNAAHVATGTLAIANGGTGATSATGTGLPVMNTSATLCNAVFANGTSYQAAGTATAPTFTFHNNMSAGMWSPSSNALSWSTAGTERMRLNSNGVLTLGNNVTSNLNTTMTTLYVGSPAASTTTISIYCEGDIAAASDARLKRNISRITDAMERIDKINGYTFDKLNKTDFMLGTESPSVSSQRVAGVLAQEVQTVLPEVVTTDSDGLLAVSYGNLTALLIEAVKELNARLKAVEAR